MTEEGDWVKGREKGQIMLKGRGCREGEERITMKGERAQRTIKLIQYINQTGEDWRSE